jgi:hypothetical protein
MVFRLGALRVLAVAAVPASLLLSCPSALAPAVAVSRGPFIGSVVEGSTIRSPSWSGYAAKGSTYDSVSAFWVQPAGRCATRDTYSGFWVGLDGYSNETVEQTGTEVDCSGGSPQYSAWYEMYPSYPVNYANVLKAGDSIVASVTASGDTFTLKISDVTQGWHHTVVKTSPGAAKSSAEVIAEAPCCTAGGDVLPLANFGTVQFSKAIVDGTPLGDQSVVRIDMRPGDGASNTDDTSVLTNGEHFSVVFKGN